MRLRTLNPALVSLLAALALTSPATSNTPACAGLDCVETGTLTTPRLSGAGMTAAADAELPEADRFETVAADHDNDDCGTSCRELGWRLIENLGGPGGLFTLR